jgi:hypothetical protein
METPHTSQASDQLNTASPSLQSDDSLRIALFTNHPKSLQALSLLEQLPGIEIVGIDKLPGPVQDPALEQ